MIEDKGQSEIITLTKPRELYHPPIRDPEASKVAAMMSTGMHTFFQFGVQKNPKNVQVHAPIT